MTPWRLQYLYSFNTAADRISPIDKRGRLVFDLSKKKPVGGCGGTCLLPHPRRKYCPELLRVDSSPSYV